MGGARKSLSSGLESGPIPPRTPGSLGVNDQADPNVTALLGDTPSSLGVLDWADPTLPPYCPGDPSAELVCRTPNWLALSVGFDAKPPEATPGSAADAISLDEAQEMALKITTYFEGGRSMNYQALADDFDGQGTSFGLLQWNFGQNTLGPLLKKMMDQNPTSFAGCFGPDADYDTLNTALVAGNQADELKWARDRIKNKREAWQSAFKSIGSNAAFNKIQVQQAASQYHPAAVGVIAEIRKIAPKLFTQIEFRTYAATFDLCVQQGSLQSKKDAALKKIKQRIGKEKPASQLEVMKIVVTERGRTASSAWQADCVSRRMGILDGAAYKSDDGDNPVKRANPQFSLINQYGAKYVSGL